MSELKSLAERVTELESQLAFQDELHAQLNDVVARQDRELLLLRARLEALENKFEELGEPGPAHSGNLADEVPPHY